MNFTFLNIPVRIQPGFWLFLLFFTRIYDDPSIESVIIGGVMMFSLLLHEYGHALTAVYFGAKPTITLEAFGGYAEYRASGITRKQQMLITLNGPLFESILIALPYFLLKSEIFSSHYYIEYTLYVMMRLNILWCLFNLIPLEPLDGGRILNNLLEEKFGAGASKVSLTIGVISAILVVPYLYFSGYMFFSLFLGIYGVRALVKLQNSIGQSKVSPFSHYMRGVEAEKSNNFDEAKRNYKRLLKSNNNHMKHSAIESLAKIYVRENKEKKAYKLLLESDHDLLKEGKCLLCKLAFQQKNYSLVGEYSRDVYAFDPSYETAILNSQAFACMNQPGLAGGWLLTASQFGIEYNDKVRELLKHEVFDSMRHDSDFNESIKTMSK